MAATVQPAGRWYTTREAFKAFAFTSTAVTDKDARIDSLIASTSLFIEEYTDRTFLPRIETKEYDFQRSDRLILDDDLLEVTTLKHQNKGTAIAAADYFLYPLNAADRGRPFLEIQLLRSDEFFVYSDTEQSDIELVGKWGFCERTRQHSTINEGAQFSNSDTTLTVTSGTDFDIGATLKIESEYLWVSNKSTNDLTVTRAVNGSTAAAHNDGTAVQIVTPPADIAFACNALVARGLHRSDASWSDRVGVAENAISFSQAIPVEVKAILNRYRRMVYEGM